MSLALLIPALGCAAIMIGIILVVRNLACVDSALPVTAEWIAELSTDKYRPMMRLLDTGDLEFLRRQPGYTPQAESRLRAQRSKIFRGYLECLNVDFHRVTTALKIVMTQSDYDRPDLAAILIHHQLQFALGMQMVRCRVLLYQFGIGAVDVSCLLRTFDLMRIELGTMLPAVQEAGA